MYRPVFIQKNCPFPGKGDKNVARSHFLQLSGIGNHICAGGKGSMKQFAQFLVVRFDQEWVERQHLRECVSGCIHDDINRFIC